MWTGGVFKRKCVSVDVALDSIGYWPQNNEILARLVILNSALLC